MKDIPFPALEADRIVTAYPKVIKAISEWIVRHHVAAREMVDEKDFLQSIKSILVWSPRSLYEFFDEQRVMLIIGEIDMHWSYHIVGYPYSASASSRKEAEERGFELAFQALEEKL